MNGKQSPVNKWIPVGIELPDDYIDVLCCNADREWQWVGYHSAGEWIKNDSTGPIEMTNLVSHWMHLQETPR